MTNVPGTTLRIYRYVSFNQPVILKFKCYPPVPAGILFSHIRDKKLTNARKWIYRPEYVKSLGISWGRTSCRGRRIPPVAPGSMLSSLLAFSLLLTVRL